MRLGGRGGGWWGEEVARLASHAPNPIHPPTPIIHRMLLVLIPLIPALAWLYAFAGRNRGAVGAPPAVAKSEAVAAGAAPTVV